MNSIEIRKSIRNFEKAQIKDSDLIKIYDYLKISSNLQGTYGTEFNLKILLTKDFISEQKIGTYGIIRNNAGFIAGVCENNSDKIFEYGYVLEKFVLFLTSMNIGTCWLGGTFDKQSLLKSIEIKDNQIIPAIIAFGYPKNREHLISFMQKKMIKANTRKSSKDLFFYENFEIPLYEKCKYLHKSLYYVRLAPSAINRQPWRLVVENNCSKVHFFIAGPLNKNKSFSCELEYLDLGIAFRHFIEGLPEKTEGKIKKEKPVFVIPKDYIYFFTWNKNEK